MPIEDAFEMFCSTAGGALQMQECSSSVESGDGRSVFATTPSGQIKMPRLGNYCLTMSGDGATKLDIGPSADVSATSTSAQHAANSIVDGNSESHWASGFDPASPVDVVLDFGAAKVIETVSIDWEHPPLVVYLQCFFLSSDLCAMIACDLFLWRGVRNSGCHWWRLEEHLCNNEQQSQ